MTMVRDRVYRLDKVLENNAFGKKIAADNTFHVADTLLTPSTNYKPCFYLDDSASVMNDLMSKNSEIAEENRSITGLVTPTKENRKGGHIRKNKAKEDVINYHAPARLLIADDNPLIRISLANLLNKWGILFTLCEDGLQAWNKLQKETFDMLIIDMQMPNMDGYEVIQQLRSSKKNANQSIPIVVIAGTDDPTMMAQIKAAGVDTHILKPFKPGALFNALVHLKNIPNYQKIRFFSDTLDKATLEELYGNDEEHILMIFRLFLKIMPEMLSEMDMALKKGNIDYLEKLLHKIKPSFTMVGLSEMTSRTQEFEQELKGFKSIVLLKTAFHQFYQAVESAIDLIKMEQQNIVNKL